MLFSANRGMVSFTIYRMEKQINLVDKYFKRMSLGCDVKKNLKQEFSRKEGN